MEVEVLLSRELLRYSKELDLDFFENFLPPEEHESARIHQRLEIEATNLIRVCRERILLSKSAHTESIVQEHRTTVERWLDEHYSLAQLQNVPHLVRRTLQLDELSARNIPSAQTNHYLAEANRAYIYGFNEASVSMSRAALEQALKERLGRQRDGQEMTLSALIQDAAAWNVIPRDRVKAAFDLKDRCNGVLHEKPTKGEDDAREILAGIRSLIEEIYNTDGHY